MTNNYEDIYEILRNDRETMEMVEKEYQREKEAYMKQQEEYEAWKKEMDEESDRAIKEALDNEHGADDVIAFLASRFFVKE